MNCESLIGSLLIKPAGASCNLNCSYCFYLPKLSLYPEKRPRMSEEVLDALIRQYLSFSGAHPSFCWQGGEPTLLGVEFFERAVELEARYARPGQILGNSLQTNATLIDRSWAEFLAEYRFLVGVSIDGPPEVHDYYRRTHSGEPSHRRVVRGLNALREAGVEYNALSMVTPRSVNEPRRIYEYLKDSGFQFIQFIPCAEIDPSTGRLAEYSVDPGAYGEFLCEVFDMWYKHDVGKIHIRFFEEVGISIVSGEASSCMFRARCGDYVVIEHNGDVYACDFFVEREWKLGNILENPLIEILRGKNFEVFARRKSQLARRCKKCQWGKLCWGGCPKYRLIAAGETEARSYFCPAYRKFFSRCLPRLEKLAETALRRNLTS